MRLIAGFGIAGYRSFGETLQRIGPFSKVNVFIGANNSGKSNILRFMREQYERSAICADLGFRASDILQANAIIWVEGPSDRIYLRHWIHSIDPDLVEGLHYSIMFYGGRLLSHLSARDSEVDDFIRLRRLNRNMAVVMDSDRNRSGAKINATKQRIQKEFEEDGGVAWVTRGCEIENYLPGDVLDEAVERVVPGCKRVRPKSHFEKALRHRKGKGQVQDRIDKVRVARLATESPTNLDVLGLRKEVERVVELIRRANS